MSCADAAERDSSRPSLLADQAKPEVNSLEAVDLGRIMQEVSLQFPGREENITGLLGHLIGEPVFVLQGMAGTGKTSILRSGVLAIISAFCISHPRRADVFAEL